MKQKEFWLFVAGLFLLLSPTLLSASDHYDIVNGPKQFYFGYISLSEVQYDGKDPVVFKENEETPEVAVINLPLVPGDTIRTSDDRRCEIQFDTGTIIRLDYNTELKIETILAQSLSSRSKISNLALAKGRIFIMYREYSSRELFQVLTPYAAVKMKNRTVAMIQTNDAGTDIQVKYGRAYALYGPDKDGIRDRKVNKHVKLMITKDNQALFGAYVEGTEFELWNDKLNVNFVELHKGESVLPKPIQKLPPAVFNFAQKYGNLYGEWIWDDLYGYVWRPYLNKHDYPGDIWKPYLNGSWRSVNNQLFWVPEEPWGWVPYHLGIWHWDKKMGWVWIPGSHFAPACVDWAFFYGYITWHPWSMWDWMFFDMTDYSGTDIYWTDSSGNLCYRPGLLSKSQPQDPIINKIRKDQLKKQEAPYPSSNAINQTRDSSKISRALMPTSSLRFKDWNPDVKKALRIGVEIHYSSAANEIQCPQLGITSKNVISPRIHAPFGEEDFYLTPEGFLDESSNTNFTNSNDSSSSSLAEAHQGSQSTKEVKKN